MQSAAESEIDVPFEAALSERYLVYALSTITARSLPDVRDGLKPVHRRLLWAMRLLRLDPAGAFKKSARVVGDVIGKYHPHGDQSVYDAMVRLAQDFALRYPLVDGQGNFGNIDGDNAAAYRYTEARLTEVARLLLEGIDEDAVDFRDTYRTGRGSFRVRSRWAKEEAGRGQWNIVVTEIPYGVPKSRLIEKIAELLQERKLPLLADIRDESAEDVRILLEPRSRTVDPVILMESLFRLTELESRIPMNVNVLAGGRVPKVLGLAECLREWLDHRREVLIRRSRHRLAAIEKRLEILRGLLIVYLDLDRVIKIIREKDEPKQELMRVFRLSELQANAILDTRLRSLRKLEEMELKRELTDLTTEKEQTEGLLANPATQWKTVAWQIREVKKSFGPD